MCSCPAFSVPGTAFCEVLTLAFALATTGRISTDFSSSGLCRWNLVMGSSNFRRFLILWFNTAHEILRKLHARDCLPNECSFSCYLASCLVSLWRALLAQHNVVNVVLSGVHTMHGRLLPCCLSVVPVLWMFHSSISRPLLFQHFCWNSCRNWQLLKLLKSTRMLFNILSSALKLLKICYANACL